MLTTVKTIWGAINELFNNKLEKGGYTGTAQNLLTEIAKKASKTTLGRIIVGNGLNVDSDGRISVAAHTHGANEVIEDSSHRMVTDAEKAAWNGKLNQGTVPTTLNSAEKIVAALQATTGLKFDPNKLYLNDPGINEEGFCYLDRLRDGIFKCLVRNEDGVNDSSKFEDISNKASADRLDNLCEYKQEIVTGIVRGNVRYVKYGNLGFAYLGELSSNGNGNIACNNPTWFKPKYAVSCGGVGNVNTPCEVTLYSSNIVIHGENVGVSALFVVPLDSF